MFPAPPSGQKVRLRGGNGPYSGYLEVSYLNEWGFVCDSSAWTRDEANIVCKQLGFNRGIRSTTQGTVLYLDTLVLLEALPNSVNPKDPISVKTL